MKFLVIILTSTIFSTSSALIIDCYYVQKGWIHLNNDDRTFSSLAYGCIAKIMTYNLQDDNITELLGDHLKGWKNEAVKVVDIDKQPYEKIPRDLASKFQNLEGLFVQESKLKSVSKLDFQPFPQLKMLSLTGNLLEQLENDMFEFTPKIYYLNLSWNLLKHIGTDFLKSLPQISIASFIRNLCVDKEVWEGNQETFKALQKILTEQCKPTTQMLEKEEEREKFRPKVRVQRRGLRMKRSSLKTFKTVE